MVEVLALGVCMCLGVGSFASQNFNTGIRLKRISTMATIYLDVILIKNKLALNISTMRKI